jgi:hypothetical protein
MSHPSSGERLQRSLRRLALATAGAERPACHCAPQRATLTTQHADQVQRVAMHSPDPTSH